MADNSQEIRISSNGSALARTGQSGLRCRIHSMAIQTAVFARAYKFYTEVVGLSVIREPFKYKTRTVAWLDGGGTLIELYSIKDGIAPGPYSDRAVGPDHIAFEVADLDAFQSVLKEYNYPIEKGPMLPPSGDPNQPRVLFATGPDGDSIQFREPERRQT